MFPGGGDGYGWSWRGKEAAMLQLMPSRLSHTPPAFASVAVTPTPIPLPSPSLHFFFSLAYGLYFGPRGERLVCDYFGPCSLESEKIGMHDFVPFFFRLRVPGGLARLRSGRVSCRLDKYLLDFSKFWVCYIWSINSYE